MYNEDKLSQASLLTDLMTLFHFSLTVFDKNEYSMKRLLKYKIMETIPAKCDN